MREVRILQAKITVEEKNSVNSKNARDAKGLTGNARNGNVQSGNSRNGKVQSGNVHNGKSGRKSSKIR